ncbi:MAG: hypothetical protein CVV41_06745 [Candidatus Riflebacteria bacterium HGW-Riflebacteria-1]|jgi:phage FluMu gp28-like protein|nr:MAG: hypothetical protein CVV41_06745 [Candidatus Riflebacteria bacterium HGW-Riflebacteria-1]
MSAPVVLLGYQQRWISDTSPVRVIEKSRRIGLSWGEAAEASLLAAAESGMDVWYIGYNKDMAQEFIRDSAFWARHYNLAAGEIEETVLADEDKDILTFRITFASGYRVSALSSRPSNLRGKQGLIIIDEAGFHEKLDELIKAAMAMLIWGGRVCLISTHNGEDNPFNELIKAIREGKLKYSLHRVTFDDALADGLYKRICLKMGIAWTKEKERAWRQEIVEFYGDGADEELFCVPSKGSGLYFSNVLLESVMQPGIPVFKLAFKDEFTTRPEEERTATCKIWWEENIKPVIDFLKVVSGPVKSYYGFDFARSGDLSVFVPLVVNGLMRMTPFIIEMKNVPFTQQRELLFYTVDAMPCFMHGAHDARGNGQYLAEVAMQKYGAGRITQVMLSEQWYSEYFPKYKTALEDRQIILSDDPDIKADHRMVKTEKGVPKVPATAKRKGIGGEQRHGDGAIGYCLAWFATLQNSVVIEYDSAGPRECSAGNLADYYGG